MQPTLLLRRAITLSLPLNLTRSLATMPPTSSSTNTTASSSSNTPLPPQSFTLDPQIFNPTLYTRIREFWFADLPPNFTGASNPSVLQRWWGGPSVPAAQKAAFDKQCAEAFLPALQTLSPSHLALPPASSKPEDETLASPFLPHVREANSLSPQQGAETLLSFIILLDQIPRNIHRHPSTLHLVYSHYDRLALSLLKSSMRLTPSPAAYEPFQLRPAVQSWILMPLMHSEDLGDHETWDRLTGVVERAVEGEGDGEAKRYVESGREAGEAHGEVLRRFGRYPHRNEGLGRESTGEERAWLSGGGGEAWGVVQGGGERDEF